MAVPDEMIWALDPHTAAKHQVLAGYYDAWFPIMLSSWPRVTVFDGYAGPGEYLGGEEGSPMIALRRLLERPELLASGKPVTFVFVEARQDRLEHLRSLVTTKFPPMPPHVIVHFVKDACEVVWDRALTASNAWGQPIFANLDPFGPGVPHPLVDRLGRNPGSEVLVTFMSDWLRRFASLEELDDGDLQFGSTRWRGVANLASPTDKELFLVQTYRETLARAGLGLTVPFKLSDEGGHSYYLIYGTGHRRGLDRMKAAMWKIDPVAGIRFRDPRDPHQGVLDFGQPEPDLSPLSRRLRERIESAGTGGLTVEELRDFALFETGFRPPHATTALRGMVTNGQLRRDPERGQLSARVRVFAS